VGYAKATGVHRLHKYDGERTSGSISYIRKPEIKNLMKMKLEPTTFKRREVAQQELGIDNQAGEHLSVCLFSLSSYRNYL
jgi:hypothetical protein